MEMINQKLKKIWSRLSIAARKNVWVYTLVAIIVAFLVFLVLLYGGPVIMSILQKSRSQSLSISGIILFYQDRCDHCANVDAFIKKNNIQDKVAFTSLEILGNGINANILADKAQTCGLDVSKIGVPFLWDGKNCIIGDVDIINFFKKEISLKTVK